MEKQRVVITGGSGFIGSFLVDRLIKEDFWDIVVLDRHPKFQRGARYVKCDVFHDLHTLDREIKSKDVIIHLASCTIPGPGTAEENPAHDAEDNLVGTIRLLNVCKDKGVSKFIFPSSGGTVYGNSNLLHREGDVVNPISSYGAIKVATETYLGVYAHLYDLEHTILRISNPYGRKRLEQRKLGAVDVFLRQAMAGEQILIWGDGNNVRDYVHIEDVIDFFLLAIEKIEVCGIYNVGTGIGTNLNEVVCVIGQIVGRKMVVTYREGRVVDVKCNILDIRKAEIAGWKPKHNLLSGIEKIYKEIKTS